jgi:hypothetical protein
LTSILSISEAMECEDSADNTSISTTSFCSICANAARRNLDKVGTRSHRRRQYDSGRDSLAYMSASEVECRCSQVWVLGAR